VSKIDFLNEERKMLRARLISLIEVDQCIDGVRHDMERVIRCDAKLRESLMKEGFFDRVTSHTIDTEKLRTLMAEIPAVKQLVKFTKKHRLVLNKEEKAP